MSIFSAIFLPGLFLIAMGVPLLISNPLVVTTIKAMPRSQAATFAFWGAGALWFLYIVWHLSAADLVAFDTPTPWFLIFAAIAVSAVYFVPDFLAVRGLCVLALLASWQVLTGLFSEYGATLLVKAAVYVAVLLSLYMACVPYRARDFIQWLFNRSQRARALGALLLAYGALLVAVAFLY